MNFWENIFSTDKQGDRKQITAKERKVRKIKRKLARKQKLANGKRKLKYY